MGKSGVGQRDFDAIVMSAKGETSTKGFEDWAGGKQVTLATVFTDVIGSRIGRWRVGAVGQTPYWHGIGQRCKQNCRQRQSQRIPVASNPEMDCARGRFVVR